MTENKMMGAPLKIFKEQYSVSLGHPDESDLTNAKKYFQKIFNSLK